MINACNWWRNGTVHWIQTTAETSQVKTIWNILYSNELGQLRQGVLKGTDGPHNKRVRGADTFKVILYAYTPVDRQKEIIYTKVVC